MTDYIPKSVRYPDHITHLTGENNYSWLHFDNGKKELLSKSLAFFEPYLTGFGFIRIHKSVMVNPIFIRCFELPFDKKQNGVVFLKGGINLPVSRRKRPSLEGVTLNGHIQQRIQALERKCKLTFENCYPKSMMGFATTPNFYS